MRVKLPEICNIQYGYAFDSACFSEDESFLPLVRIRDVVRGYSETYYCGDYSDEYIVREGDLLIGMDGEFNIARWRGGNALLNQRVCRVTANDGTDEEYLRFALMKALKTIEDKTAFVTVKHLSAKELNKLMLDVPPFEDQRIIANSLSAIERIIETRQLELRKLDDLIKARFVEMFGDPHRSKIFPYCAISELTDVISGGTPDRKKGEYWNGGTIPWVKTTELQNTVITEVEEKITERGLAESSAKIVPASTVLIAMYGQGKTRGMTGYLGIDACTNQACACLLPTGRIDMQYLWHYLILSYDKLREMAQGGNQPNLNAGMIKAFPILVPPLEQQRQFVSIVSQVDKSKVVEDKPLWKNNGRLVA